jgi:uncharacterized membrane-anchored protein YitT (DUF2179 family)
MKKTIKSALIYLYIVLLGMLMATGYILFVIPNNYAPAGINGIAVMVQYKLHFSVGFMSLLINVPLCIFAFFAVNRKFAVNTLIFCLSYSLFYLLLQNVSFVKFFSYDAGGVDTVYPVIISGLISGFCYGSLFRLDSSTGGTDIVAKYVSKRRPYLNFFWVTFTINAAVAISSLFVYSSYNESGLIWDFKPVCLCVMYCFISSFVGNVILKGSRSACEFVIVTPYPDEIEKEIVAKLKHTATKLIGTGVYGKTEKTILICVINKHQMVEFETILKRFDETFAFVAPVNETIGNFKKIK